MARLSEANLITAKEIIGRYPKARSATIPLLHLAQEQDGYVADDAIKHISELIGATAAEVLGTCTFYEMFKREPVGTYLINVCQTMSCQLMGADDLMHHAECQAACTEAPTLQVNYRYRFRVTSESFDALVDDLRAGKLADEIPPHGTLARNRQHIPADRVVGAVPPEQVTGPPVWVVNAEAPTS